MLYSFSDATGRFEKAWQSRKGLGPYVQGLDDKASGRLLWHEQDAVVLEIEFDMSVQLLWQRGDCNAYHEILKSNPAKMRKQTAREIMYGMDDSYLAESEWNLRI